LTWVFVFIDSAAIVILNLFQNLKVLPYYIFLIKTPFKGGLSHHFP